MLPVRCINCGLINIPERQTCKRCQALLQRPRAQDSAQIITPDQTLSDTQSLIIPRLWGSFAISYTISSPLRFTLAQQRLAMLLEMADAGQLRRSGFSFHGERNGDSFRLYGPNGNRSWPLVTRGELIAVPEGARVALTIRPSWIYPIGIIAVFGWWLWGALTMLHGAFVVLPFVGLVAVIAALFGTVKWEGQIILDLLVDALSIEPVFAEKGMQER
jgi:hypothetical protein